MGALANNPTVLGGFSQSAGGGVISPDGISATQVAYGSGTNQIKGEAAFTYAEASNTLTVDRLSFPTGTTSSFGLNFFDTPFYRTATGTLRIENLAGTAELNFRDNSGNQSRVLMSTTMRLNSDTSVVVGTGGSTVAATFDNSQRLSLSGATDTSSSGTFTPVTIARTYNQTGTAGSIDLLINRTETALGSGDQMHMEMQVGGVRRWSLGTRRTTTTDATVTTLATIPVPASTTLGVTGYVVARRTGGTAGTAEDGAYYRVETVYKNAAGTATNIGTTVTVIGESQAGWDVTVSQSSGNVLIQVTGAVDNNVTWMGVFHRNPIST